MCRSRSLLSFQSLLRASCSSDWKRQRYDSNRCARVRAHLIHGGVILREAKHLWLFPLVGSFQKRSEMESLASRTSSAALQLRFAQNDSYEAVGSKPNEKMQDR